MLSSPDNETSRPSPSATSAQAPSPWSDHHRQWPSSVGMRNSADAVPPQAAMQANALPVASLHVNYAWRSLDRVKYPRFTQGLPPVLVLPYDGTGTPIQVEMAMILRTQMLHFPRQCYRDCADYILHDACERGESCSFVHRVHIDPDAKLYAKASGVRRRRRNLPERDELVIDGTPHMMGSTTSVTPPSTRPPPPALPAAEAMPPRYFFRNPYAATEVDRKVFVSPSS